MKVSEIMNRRFQFVQPDTPIRMVEYLMLRYRQNYMVVVDGEEDKLAGIITPSDIFRKLLPSQEDFMEKQESRLSDGFSAEDYRNLCDRPVQEIMTKRLFTIHPQMSIIRAGALMNARRFKQIPVVTGEKLVGVLHQTDIHLALMVGYGAYDDPA